MTDQTPDVSAEAVERLRERLLLNTPVITQEHMDAATETMPQAAAAIAALRAERDALKKERDKLQALYEVAIPVYEVRDQELRAEVARMSDLLKTSLNAVNWSFYAGAEERENGSARRQGQHLDKVRAFEKEVRAELEGRT